jgi:hypothetical protein
MRSEQIMCHEEIKGEICKSIQSGVSRREGFAEELDNNTTGAAVGDCDDLQWTLDRPKDIYYSEIGNRGEGVTQRVCRCAFALATGQARVLHPRGTEGYRPKAITYPA